MKIHKLIIVEDFLIESSVNNLCELSLSLIDVVFSQ